MDAATSKADAPPRNTNKSRHGYDSSHECQHEASATDGNDDIAAANRNIMLKLVTVETLMVVARLIIETLLNPRQRDF